MFKIGLQCPQIVAELFRMYGFLISLVLRDSSNIFDREISKKSSNDISNSKFS